MKSLRSVAVAAAAVLAVLSAVLQAPTAAADPAPPYVDHVEWAKWGDLSSLRVYPTPSGRQASLVDTVNAQDQAWAEVLVLAPEADMPGMYHQFVCHWQLAELGYPGKPSWNLEPWRPEVSDEKMVDTRCNPGGTEEPF